jgi:hypothetical protein
MGFVLTDYSSQEFHVTSIMDGKYRSDSMVGGWHHPSGLPGLQRIEDDFGARRDLLGDKRAALI